MFTVHITHHKSFPKICVLPTADRNNLTVIRISPIFPFFHYVSTLYANTESYVDYYGFNPISDTNCLSDVCVRWEILVVES